MPWCMDRIREDKVARDPEREFSRQTKMQALARQDFLCASCASLILPFAGKGLVSVAWGESAHAHHRRPMKPPFHGGANVENCVILCDSCHINAHEGGRYRTGTAWGRIADFPYFHGTRGGWKE